MASVAEVTAPGFRTGLDALAIEDLRARRAAAQEVEVSLSYLRRMVQGRLDIAQAGPDDVVDRLPEILGDKVVGGAGRLSAVLAPGELPEDLAGDVDTIARADPAGLVELEARLSAQRREVHEVIDAFQAELVRRYRSGQASVDTLLG